MNTVLFLSLVFVAAIVLVGSHYYVYRQVIKASDLPPKIRKLSTLVLFMLAGLIPGVFIASRVVSRQVLGSVAMVAYFWLGTVFYLVIFLFARDVAWVFIRVLKRLGHKPEQGSDAPKDPGRRLFLKRVTAGACVLGSTSMTGVGIGGAFADPMTPEVRVRLSRLPPSLSGFRIALLSDLHIGPVLGGDFLKATVDLTNSLEPDLVAITGDLVDMPVDRLAEQVRVLEGLHAPHGVFFTTGNHEYFFGAGAWIEFIGSLGIRVLANEMVLVGDPDGACFELAGIHDYSGAWFDPHLAPDPHKAMAAHDPDKELVLLAHQPKQITGAHSYGVSLQLSGHTHGGQIWPFGSLVQLDQPYMSGLHQHDEHTQIFVTRGVGFWGPPMRVGAPSEIPVIVLSS